MGITLVALPFIASISWLLAVGLLIVALGVNQLLVSQLEMARLPPGYLLAGAVVIMKFSVRK